MNRNGTDDEITGLDGPMTDDLYTALDDDRRAELSEMIGLKVLDVELWEESLGDEDEPIDPAARAFFDCGLYLEDHAILDLYVTSIYFPSQQDPVMGMAAIEQTLARLADDELELVDYGEADEDEGGLALAFGHGDKVELVMVASAWMVDEWEADEEGAGDA